MNFLRLFTINRVRLVAGISVFAKVLVIASMVLAAAGGTVTAPRVPAGFRFELESPPQSLQEVPTWTELEQLLDNPYAMELAADQYSKEEINGYPSYITTITRRRSFLPAGCDYNPATAPPDCDDSLAEQFVIHPLNYNPMTGEELRLLNPNYAGGEFPVPAELVQCGVGNPNESAFCGIPAVANSLFGPVDSPANDPNRYVWIYETVEISPGCESEEECRVEETSLDFNSPFRADAETVNETGSPARYPDLSCMVGTEAMPPEGSIICGADTGEPGYAGFGVLNTEGYSVPAVPGVAAPTEATTGQMLYDPAGCDERNEELPGSCIPADDGGGWIVRLLRPTIRNADEDGDGIADLEPDYLQNSLAALAADPSALTSSNENDYYRGDDLTAKLAARDEAAALGKALFWDMQVGSDGVQACGSCHFVAGADDRTKNQVNPNHFGVPADLIFTLAQPNEEVIATDFPLSPGNDVVGTNDVVSSMGVHFGMFGDIPSINTWTTVGGIRVLPKDLRSTTLSNVDPIPGFAGTSTDPALLGHEFRRVEPRNTPTLLNSDFNFDTFWDGRARHDFNGGSVFGAADPQAHVWACGAPSGDTCTNPNLNFAATRQIIRNVSLASLATGPGLSEFEMSLQGRNWAKIGKKLLQGASTTNGGRQLEDNVTPLANQLVDPTDSVLGKYSNQGGSACNTTDIPLTQRSGSWTSNTDPGLAVGKPGLCISYSGLIERAFYPNLWITKNRHLNGAPGADPFDGYVLTMAPAGEGGIDSAAERNNSNKFTQMEANFALFWGLSVHAWGSMLISDDAPFDRFMEANPDAFKSLGEPNETGLVNDMLGCDQTGGVQPCYTESGPFKRDPGIPLNLDSTIPGFEGVTTGTRQPGDPDPLLGFDIFHGFNLSGKNPDFLIARCGECHAGGELTDHTMSTSNQLNFGDFVAEFVIPGVEIVVEPLGRNRLISGFSLEGELGENAQDAVERRIINQSVFSDPALGGDGLHYPDGSAFFDNGMYNIGVTPCEADYAGNIGSAGCNDIGRGALDPWGNPLSLARLMLLNLEAGAVPGQPLANFDPDMGTTGGLFDESAQDQLINPGHEEEPAEPQLPAHLAPFASNVPVGDEVQQDEAGGGGAGMVNTFMEDPLLEGLVDTLGPFNPAGTIGETYNNSPEALMGTWPVVNRVGFMGSVKAPGLRNVELTGPYFHNGGKLTLAQVVDFYSRGGDFATTNATHRDFNIMNLEEDIQAQMTPEQEIALIDYLLTFTDDRVKYEQAPFDHPEIFVPLDGRAPENTFGRAGFVARLTGDCLGFAGAGPCFRQIPAVGAAGLVTPIDSFMGVNNIRPNEPGFNCSASAGSVSQYCIVIDP